jgi:hypothetical protein
MWHLFRSGGESNSDTTLADRYSPIKGRETGDAGNIPDKRKGFSNEEESTGELAAADGNGPCSAHASVRIFSGLWLNFVEEHVAHAWRLDWTLSGKGRVAN